MNRETGFLLVGLTILASSLAIPLEARANPSILWISEHHDTAGNLSILNTGPLGYSQAAALAQQMGAVNLEVDDSVAITPQLLAPHSLVIVGVSETGTQRSQAEQDAIAAYIAGGGRLFVICGGIANAGAYANSVSQMFGVAFDIDSTPGTGYADTFLPDPLTAGISSLIFIGPNYLTTESPAVLLGMSEENGLLARRDYGSGSVAFWGDDWAFMNGEWDNVDNKLFVENVLQYGLGTASSQENLLIWPLWDGRIWTYHCQDSNGTEWTETREVIDSNVLGEEQYYKVRITDNCPYAPTQSDFYVRSTDFAFYQWQDGNEVMIITAGPVGVGILNGDMVREITSKDLMTVPYGGPYESYTYGFRGLSETSYSLTASFVQGLGFIEIVDHSSAHAPVVKQLQSIDLDHLCGDYGHPYPTGDMNLDCMVDMTDFAVLADNWLQSTL